jgi:hypothetical protein
MLTCILYIQIFYAVNPIVYKKWYCVFICGINFLISSPALNYDECTKQKVMFPSMPLTDALQNVLFLMHFFLQSQWEM